ncbi:tail protein X [Photobacterium sp. J15]|uniref:tail protein X n=1 Tax=Photobacterium sp. J15 TaxID=265901 RepID=UPI0007E48C32|nr:tail protein X [Photobacterium sp. J15]
MEKTYRTREGDMLDDICYRHYGRESTVTEVLKVNPGLAEYGPILPSGLEIKLPPLTAPVVKSEANSLWD